ncbi:hypothetical protein AQUCO_04900098v1 [Aquilegia coerulea]|uniref:Sec-independent protein translocase protein TATA, chloroplastic n=1 Tax=Aquilegia coerulea TaxID=218851 RepID=A0A2G5CJW9_AQUCA|nr:hypothetical protein AQUCO_04900098v1 [Aquilegia coerulea]
MEISATLSPSLTLITTTKSLSSSSFASSNSLYFNNNNTNLFNKNNNTSSSSCSISIKRSNRRFNCRSMFGLGIPEIAVIAGVTTLLFGPKMVPELGRSIGQTVKSFQQAAKEFESELKKESQPATDTLTDSSVASEEQQDVN